jgi:hypothetical protein
MFHLRESSGTARAIASRRRAFPNTTHPTEVIEASDCAWDCAGSHLKPLRNLNPGRFVQTYLCWGRPLLGRQGGTEMPNSTSRRWTAAEIVRLKNLAQKYPPAEIAARLGRTPSATATKDHELKLSLKFRHQSNQEPTVSGADPGPAGFDWHE